jgi:hypothetical protein
VGFVYPIALCCQTGSAYLTLAVTLERYVAVCWSLKARHLCTQVSTQLGSNYSLFDFLSRNIFPGNQTENNYFSIVYLPVCKDALLLMTNKLQHIAPRSQLVLDMLIQSDNIEQWDKQIPLHMDRYVNNSK